VGDCAGRLMQDISNSPVNKPVHLYFMSFILSKLNPSAWPCIFLLTNGTVMVTNGCTGVPGEKATAVY
jgi:hypothetical protein